MCQSSIDRLPPQPPSRAQTVTNNLAMGGVGPPTTKDTNIRGSGASMDGVETVRVTDMTSSSAFTKSIGSLFSTINKSVSSAFNSLMAAPPTGPPGPGETAATPPSQTAPIQSEIDVGPPLRDRPVVSDWQRGPYPPSAHHYADHPGYRGTHVTFR